VFSYHPVVAVIETQKLVSIRGGDGSETAATSCSTAFVYCAVIAHTAFPLMWFKPRFCNHREPQKTANITRRHIEGTKLTATKTLTFRKTISAFRRDKNISRTAEIRGVAQCLGRRSLARGLFLTYT